MSGLAVVILAHRDIEQVARLVKAVAGLPIFLHWDARTAGSLLPRLRPLLPPTVTVLPSTRTTISSWSLVEAELRAVRAALRSTRAAHVAVLTGADYPLVGVEEMLAALRPWEGSSFLYNVPLPFQPWSSERHPDGGLWRFRYRFATWRGQLVHCAGIPVYWPVPRAIPPGLALRASSQWKVYGREHAELLLKVVETRPQLIRFWQHTLIPEESFAASVLASPAIAGSNALPPCRANAWYYDFQGQQHPKWLSAEDFGRLSRARWSPLIDPGTAFGDPSVPPPAHRKLFARKFSTDLSAALLDQVDAELRLHPGPQDGGKDSDRGPPACRG